jgi:glycosyltransferase involved in cell wall biosynthesis
MPAYNRSAFIGEAIASLQGQAGVEGDIIVVDDGSTDDTARIVEGIATADRRVRLLLRSHGGVAAARNTGIAAITGDYVTFLDSDDICAPGRLARQAAKLQARPDVAAVVGDLVLFDEMTPDFQPAPNSQWERVLGVSLTTATFRRSVFDEIGPMDESLRQGEDLDFYMRLIETGALFLIEVEVATYYRRHAGNMTNDVRGMRRDAVRALFRSRMRQRRSGRVGFIEPFFYKKFEMETEFGGPGHSARPETSLSSTA